MQRGGLDRREQRGDTLTGLLLQLPPHPKYFEIVRSTSVILSITSHHQLGCVMPLFLVVVVVFLNY